MYYTALIGNPTSHSVSHVMYSELFKLSNIQEAYSHIKIDVEELKLLDSINSFRTLKFKGINVTLPHKLSIMQHLDHIDVSAKNIGAVNTVVFTDIATGYNTDWTGIYRPLSEMKRKFKTVSILGSGGASRAAIYAARELGAEKIFVFYRNEDVDNYKTEDLKKRSGELGITLKEYRDIKDPVSESELVLNATSAGMIGKDLSPFNLKELEEVDLSQKVFFDVVFNPLRTPLLDYFSKRGGETVDGLWMMIYQGIHSLELWTNKKIDPTKDDLLELHGLLKAEIERNV